MTGQEKAASPVPSVRDVFYYVIGPPENEVDDVCETLGIDPDMPIETLRRRLLIGARVESYWVDDSRELHAEPVVGHLVGGEGGVMYMAEALLRQLTRPADTDGES